MAPYLQQYCQRHTQEYIRWNRNRHKPRKSTTGMLLLSLLRVQDNDILPNGMKRLQGFVLTVQRVVTCTCHLNPLVAISIYGWRYQAKHYCAYVNGLPCLLCLRAPPFTLQIKLLHPCVSFLGTNYKNALQQVLCKLWFIYYLSSSKSFEKYWFKNFVHLMKQKVLA